jgi:hypothetical protein
LKSRPDIRGKLSPELKDDLNVMSGGGREMRKAPSQTPPLQRQLTTFYLEEKTSWRL